VKCEVWPVGCRSASKCDREPLEGCAPRGRVASRSVVLGPLCRVPGMCIEWVSALAALAGICGDYCTLLVHWTHVLSASVVRGLCLSRVGHRRDQCTHTDGQRHMSNCTVARFNIHVATTFIVTPAPPSRRACVRATARAQALEPPLSVPLAKYRYRFGDYL